MSEDTNPMMKAMKTVLKKELSPTHLIYRSTGTWVQKGMDQKFVFRDLYFMRARLSKELKEVIIPEGEKAVLEAEKIFKEP